MNPGANAGNGPGPHWVLDAICCLVIASAWGYVIVWEIVEKRRHRDDEVDEGADLPD